MLTLVVSMRSSVHHGHGERGHATGATCYNRKT